MNRIKRNILKIAIAFLVIMALVVGVALNSFAQSTTPTLTTTPLYIHLVFYCNHPGHSR